MGIGDQKVNEFFIIYPFFKLNYFLVQHNRVESLQNFKYHPKGFNNTNENGE